MSGVRCAIFVTLLLCVSRSHAQLFQATFNTSSFGATVQGSQDFGIVLMSFFTWTNPPIFSSFDGVVSVSDPGVVVVSFTIGTSDPSAEQLQQTYATQLATYLQTSIAGLQNALYTSPYGISLVSIMVITTTAPTSASDDQSFLSAHYPALIVGGVAAVVVIAVIVVCIVMRRRAMVDDRIFDTMEAMLDTDDGSQRRGPLRAPPQLPPPQQQSSQPSRETDPQERRAAPLPLQQM